MGKIENQVLNNMTLGALVEAIEIHRERMDQLVEPVVSGMLDNEVLTRERARTHNMVNVLYSKFGFNYATQRRMLV